MLARSPRYPARFRAVFDDGDTFVAGPVRDISDSGLFLQTQGAVALEQGRRVKVVPLVPESAGLFELEGEVARVASPRDAGGPGVGVRFLGLDADGKRRIRAFGMADAWAAASKTGAPEPSAGAPKPADASLFDVTQPRVPRLSEERTEVVRVRRPRRPVSWRAVAAAVQLCATAGLLALAAAIALYVEERAAALSEAMAVVEANASRAADRQRALLARLAALEGAAAHEAARPTTSVASEATIGARRADRGVLVEGGLRVENGTPSSARIAWHRARLYLGEVDLGAARADARRLNDPTEQGPVRWTLVQEAAHVAPGEDRAALAATPGAPEGGLSSFEEGGAGTGEVAPGDQVAATLRFSVKPGRASLVALVSEHGVVLDGAPTARTRIAVAPLPE